MKAVRGSSGEKRARDAGALTARESAFVREYLIDLNASAALRRAGSRSKSPDATAARVMARPRVKAAIQEGMAGRAARLDLTADQVVRELACIAFSRMDDVATWGPEGFQLKDSARLIPEVAATVASVRAYTTEAGSRVSIRLHDKVRALQLLMAHLGMQGEGEKRTPPTEEGLINMIHAYWAMREPGEGNPTPVG